MVNLKAKATSANDRNAKSRTVGVLVLKLSNGIRERDSIVLGFVAYVEIYEDHIINFRDPLLVKCIIERQLRPHALVDCLTAVGGGEKRGGGGVGTWSDGRSQDGRGVQ